MKAISKHLLLACVILAISCSKKKDITSDGAPEPGTLPKTDTLTVMAYNILNYGDLCQGSTAVLDSYFKTIVAFIAPDLMSCEKMTAPAYVPGASENPADEINTNVLNAVSPGNYAYAPPTNASGGSTLSVLYYNRKKLACVKTDDLLSLVTDFDLYTFYYKDVNLPVTRDTTFLYVAVCHTKSGENSVERDFQDSSVMASLSSRFGRFPNLLIMGDFNTRGSYERGYQAITGSKDSAQAMSDPPYYPDRKLTYPGNWSLTPSFAAPFLTTSTRPDNQPNSCGAGGGGKGWYDHIFISNWLRNGDNYMQYIRNSYQSVGNDGDRTAVGINSSLPVANSTLPANVLDALYHFSDKYPVMLRLSVRANRNGVSPSDPGKN